MALAQTPVRISVICPALVVTGMSPEGVDPAAVADQGPQAVDDTAFAVVPAAWRARVIAQVEQVTVGNQPTPP